MKLALIFSSTEGQTRKIARFAFEKLSAADHSVAMLDAKDALRVDPGRFDAAILAGSVHMGTYQKELVAYARAFTASLNAISTLFLSVSLAAAGDDPDDWKGLGDVVDEFISDTGWTPTQVEHIAGAIKFTEYDFFRYWAMRWIEGRRDPEGEAGVDREYTDWPALERTLSDWTARVSGGTEGSSTP